jgi:hypothetical protein
MSRHSKGHGSPKKRAREFTRQMKRMDDERESRERRQQRQQQRLREAMRD